MSNELTGFRKAFFNVAQKLPRNEVAFRFSLVLRKLALKGVNEVEAEQFGLRWHYYPHQNLADRFALFSPKFYEDEERTFLDQSLKPGDVFLDIGANIGFYSLYAARVTGENGRVLAFEPNPTVLTRFRRNIELNGFAGRIEVLPIGLADREGSFDLFLHGNNLGAASIVGNPSGDKITIPCRPLVDVLMEKSVDRIDFLKIDVEGAEPMILKPFFEKAPRSLYPRFVLIESPDGVDWRNLGYETIKRTHSHNTLMELRG